MKVPLFNSLRFRMPLIVLTGVIPLMLIAIFYASDRASRAIREEAIENLDLKGDLLAESVNRWNQLNVLVLQSLSEQPNIVSMNPEEQKPVLSRITDNYKHIYLAHTVNQDGLILARSDNNKSGGYRGDRYWFKGAMAGNQVTYQTLISRTLNKPAVCISAPIREEKFQQITGVLALCTDLETLVKQIGQLRFGKTGYALIVDDSGQILAHPDLALISGEQLKNYSTYPPVRNILQGGKGNFFFTDDLDINWFSYDIPLDNGWGIVIVQQEAELFKSKREFQKVAFFVAAVAVIGVSGSIWLLANRLIQPISNLTEAATTISNGQLDRTVQIKRRDELGILARSFNRMASQLKSFFEQLEDRIEERTAELKKAKEVAEVANQTKDQFLAHVTHELRTPLNSILGYTQLLERDRNLSSRQIKSLKIVEKNGHHLLTLINDILDFAKSRAGKMELYPTDLHLPSFLDAVVDIVQMWATEKELSFKCDASTNLPTKVWVDEKRLRQVLINLLSNAVKFTASGEVILRVKVIESVEKSAVGQTQQKLRFEVSDTGVGIPSQQLETIFQPFEQVGNAQSRIGGTGLGLSISKELVELMGSQLEVNSELGKGSTFWFDLVLPVAEVGYQTQMDRSSEIVGYKGRRRKLLAVDDIEENLLLLTNMLEPLGFEVAIAKNGKQMLQIASSSPPDLILLDLFMPVKTGFTSVKQLRQISELKNVPVIILSANYITDKVRQYLECEAYMTKPIDEKKLLALLQQYLELDWIYQ